MSARGVIQSPVLVGRDAFLTLIERRLADTAAGSGQLMFVAGEAGIGKTRLLDEVVARAAARGMTVIRGSALGARVAPLGALRGAAATFGIDSMRLSS